ncbi:MAG: hypothetical protein ABWY55_06060 [Microbacterium sp.]
MSVPDPRLAQPVRTDFPHSSLLRAAIWVAIGALIAAAIVCVVWVFVGPQNGIIGRAFATILLLVAFAGAAILDAHLAARRPAWFALSSMAGWVLLLLIGAVMIWLPERYMFSSFGRFVQFLLIVLIVQLLLLHLRLFVRASGRYVTVFTRIVTGATIGLVVGLAAMLIIPLVVWEFVTFSDLYWRVVVALAILAAVGTTLIPLVNALFAPKKARAGAPQPEPAPAPLQAWPTFVDGVTPLPILQDGSPDWNAYYTGYPSPGAQVFAPVEQPAAPPAVAPPQAAPAVPAPAAPVGYEGYPPPPPLPPRP